MADTTLVRFTHASVARAARGEVELALGPDIRTWRWSQRISGWVDALVLLEEAAAR